MSRPWMPLYIADYLADTAHLRAAESGAYLHLIMHYWRRGSLPADDGALARVAKMTLDEWRVVRPTIQAFFTDGWKHGRIEFELTEAARILAQTKAAGKASGQARRTAKWQPKTNGRSSMIKQQHQSLAQGRPKQHANGRPTECERLQPPSRIIKTRARARESGGPSVLKEESEARKEKRARVKMDTPQWDAWQAHLKAHKGKGSPYDKQGGWYFPTEWPPGYQPSKRPAK
jgi:uncharacterized protein YdaU (DUF1376 family)